MDEMMILITGGYDSRYYRAYFMFRQCGFPMDFVSLKKPRRFMLHCLSITGYTKEQKNEEIPLISDFETIHALAWAESGFCWPIKLEIW